MLLSSTIRPTTAQGGAKGHLSPGSSAAEESSLSSINASLASEPFDSVSLSQSPEKPPSLPRKAVTEFLYWTRKLALSLAAPVAGLTGIGFGLSPARLTGASEFHALGIDGRGTRVAILDQGFTQFGAGSEDVLGVYEVRNGQFQEGLKRSGSDPVAELVTRQRGLSFHGNAMAAIVTGESLGLTGVAPGAEILGISVVDERGQLKPGLFLKGLEWVAENHQEQKIKAVSASVNYWAPTDEERQKTQELVAKLKSEGVAVVVAAGNRGPAEGTLTFPADVPGVVSVGAYTTGLMPSSWDDRVERYSGRGGSGKPGPTLLAPGGDIFTKDNHGMIELTKGTSNSAPMVAGAIALLSQAFPEASVDHKIEALTSTAQSIHGSSEVEGAGAMRLRKAFQVLG